MEAYRVYAVDKSFSAPYSALPYYQRSPLFSVHQVPNANSPQLDPGHYHSNIMLPRRCVTIRKRLQGGESDPFGKAS